MKKTSRAALLVLVAVNLLGCPHSNFYRPSDAEEKKLFAQSQTNVFPDDVRHAIDQHRIQILRWSGILLGVKPPSQTNGLHLLIQHHYWDWIENHSVQKAVVFLSPRGEGTFECVFPADRVNPNPAKVQSGDMVIVYGIPNRVSETGLVVLDCSYFNSYKQGLYATDVFDYGRNYLLKQDLNDFKVLRVPVR